MKHILILIAALLVIVAVRRNAGENPKPQTAKPRETPSAKPQPAAPAPPQVPWNLGLDASLGIGDWSLELPPSPMCSNDIALLHTLAPELSPEWDTLSRDEKLNTW